MRDLCARFGLSVSSMELASALAAEWDAQKEVIDPPSMPLTQLVSTAIDRVPTHRAAIIDELLAYGGSDLLCYRAEAPRDLVLRQEEVWQPLVDWASVVLGAEFVVAGGIVPVAQPSETLDILRAVIGESDDLGLAALQSAVGALGSLILGLALARQRLDPDQAFAVSQLDETYQIEQWGEDAETCERRRLLLQDVTAAGRLMAFSRQR